MPTETSLRFRSVLHHPIRLPDKIPILFPTKNALPFLSGTPVLSYERIRSANPSSGVIDIDVPP
jgi:hypothetical protein